MVNNALKSAPGECLFERYPWINPELGEKAPRSKLSANIYFAPWDWIIFASIYEDDFIDAKEGISGSFNRLTMAVLSVGLLVLVLMLVAAIVMGNRITRPLSLIIGVVSKVAAGDVHAARGLLAAALQRRRAPGAARRMDEISQLVEALETMTAGLDGLIGQVQHSGVQVTTSAMQISASARQIESTVAEQAASTREVNATSKEIASTAENLVHTMEEVGRTVVQTAATAETGRANLGRMESAMRQLIKATAAISSQLGVINDKANRISSVITAINKISDQTNLLSLNAAIEAEKAGEYGKGFSVVARETNRLADQTVIATQDIERMVREMQSSVSSGVMEMDKFAEEVRQGVQEVATISAHLGQVIDQVKALESRFDSVKDGMRNQSDGAQQISEAVNQLSTAADQTRQALHEFNQATAQLTKVVQGLKQEVSRFKISAQV
jgi:methyl-accepting chemotaxis protein WspA